jgi:hypothetical protein
VRNLLPGISFANFAELVELTADSMLHDPNLRVQLKKVHGFYKGFLHFPSIRNVFPRFPTKSAVFSRFISVSGNPRQLERMNYNGFAAISVV